MLLVTSMSGVKKERKLSDIAGSCTITREDWEKVIKAFELQRKLNKERVKRLIGKARVR